MTVQLGRIWDETLARIASEDHAPSLDGWLRTIRPLALQDGMVVIACPNEFAREWLQKRCESVLRRVLSGIAARDMGVRFVTSPESVAEVAPGPAVEAAQAAAEAEVATAVRDVGAHLTHTRGLNPRYTFESFVVGASNRFAHAATKAVAESPAKVYNPLFIYGGVGLGKTHLLQAIAHHVLGRDPRARVAYVSSEAFTNELIASIRSGTMGEFRTRYRNVALLLVDDVQFIAGKEATQEEFFHTFNALHESSRQIVVTSDRPPKEIPTLVERLRSRFEWGLIADIQPPDFETRVAILRKKAFTDRVEVPSDVLHYIATKFDSNIRELEGALVRVVALASLSEAALTLETASTGLRDIVPAARPKPISIPAIQRLVAEYYQLPVDELLAKRRTRAVAFPRQVAMYLARELTDASLPRIGEAFGGRDHTTVIHACTRVKQALAQDAALCDTVRELTQKAKGQ